ncbi:putative integral membrane protein [Nocardioidaceae bacterium Broad-1]|nr:putative integral membrane protein [Nocardioidaceae bacterium Broad-1]
MKAVVAAAGALGLVLISSVPARATGDDVLFSFSDPTISEASALTPLGKGLYATTNDSGDSGRVFTVDSSGDTVGVTHWAADPVDVEGLAPAGRHHVWVGDIGDNNSVWDSIRIAKVRVGRGERTVSPTVYELVYPDGPHNAESLLAHPDGQVFVATKDWGGGRLYAVPKRLDPDGPNRLKEVAPVIPMATDGAFFPDGKHLVVRGYYSATIYDWPSMDRVGSFRTPDQEQGEAIGVTATGEVVVTSEGIRAEVIRVAPELVSEVLGEEPTPTADPSPDATEPPDDETGAEDSDAGDESGGGSVGPAALVVLAVAAYFIFRKRS